MKVLHKLNERYWVLIFVFFLFSMAIGSTGYFFYQRQKENIKGEKWNELKAVADMKVNQIVNWREERVGDAKIIFENPFIASSAQLLIGNPENLELKAKVLVWMSAVKKYSLYESAFLLDPKGSIRLSVSDKKGSICPYTGQMIEEAARTRKIVLTDLHRSQPLDSIHIGLIIPILAPDTHKPPLAALLLLQIDPSRFLYPLVQEWPTPSKSAETLLVRREGEEVVFLNELRHRKGTALTLRFPINEKQLPAAMGARGQEGIVEGRDYRGIEVLAAIRHVPDSPWMLISKVDQEEIYAPIRRQGKTISIVVAILITGVGLVASLLWKGEHLKFQKQQYETEVERVGTARRFDYLTKYANDIFLLTDQNLKIVEANDRALSSYGYTHDELLQLNLRELLPPDLRTALDAQIGQIEQSNGLVYETLHQRKDGTAFPVEVSSRFIEVSGKRFCQSIIRDITERTQVEEVLQFTHRLLKIANRHTEISSLLKEYVAEIKKFTSCSAAAIRILDDRGNIPYQAYEGFKREFYELENPLSIKSDQCMCINVIRGVTDPKLPFYTGGGSFYMNSTTRFLATVPEEEKGQTRNVCNQYGFESVALVPIRVEGRILGLIHVADLRENMIPLKIVETLEKVSMQLGTALLRVQVGGALNRQREELAIHASILSTLLMTTDMDQRLNLILDHILAFLKIEVGSIHLVKKNELLLHCWRGVSDNLRVQLLSFPMDKIPGWMREPITVHERLNERGITPDFFKNEWIQAWTSVPLYLRAKEMEWFGVILVAGRRYEALDEDQVKALHGIADQLALSIDNVRTYRQAQESMVRLQTLREIDRAIIQRLDLIEVLHVVLERVPREFGADAVAISLLEEKGLRTEVFTMRDTNGRMIEEEAFTLVNSLLHWFVDRKEPVIIYDLTVDPRMQMHRKRIRNGKLISYLGVPLVVQDKTIGILHILATKPTVFADEDISFFTTMAGQAAIAIENVRMVRALRETRDYLEKLLNYANAPIIVWDPLLRITRVNHACERLTGFTAEEATGQKLSILFPESGREKWLKKVERARNGEYWESVEIPILHKNGDIRIVLWNSARIYAEDGTTLLSTIAQGQEITERKRTEEALNKSYEQIRNLTSYLQTAREEERTSIARVIHDDIGQTLIALRMDSGWLEKRVPKEQMLERVTGMSKMIDTLIEMVKRISSDLRPGILDDFGIGPAIEWQAQEFQKRADIDCEVMIDPGEMTLDKDLSITIFRIFQEAMTNIARHASATKVSVTLEQKENQLVLAVKDNGKGITQEQISNPKSYGLLGIQERAYIYGGEVAIKGVQGQGTMLIVTIPLKRKGETG